MEHQTRLKEVTERDTVVSFVVMLIVWMTLKAFTSFSLSFKHLSPFHAKDVRNRFVAMIHGTVASLVFGLVLFLDLDCSLPDNRNAIEFVTMFSTTYFIYDTIDCIKHGLLPFSMLFHHIMCFVGMALLRFYPLAKQDYHFACFGAVLGECSNCLMHYREILRLNGFKHTQAFNLVDGVFMFVFSLARGPIAVFFLLIPSFWKSINPVLHFTGTVLILFAVGTVFALKNNLKEKISNYREMVEKDVYYEWISHSYQLKKLSFYNKEPLPLFA